MKKLLLDISDVINKNYGENKSYQVKDSLTSPDPENFSIDKPIAGNIKVTNLETSFLIELQFTATLIPICSRCGEKFSLIKKLSVKKNLKIAKLVEHKYINLEPIIREEIIITLPIKPLCSKLCKGRCPQCGINKNKIKCKCKTKITNEENPFARLKEIIEKENDGRTKKEINKKKSKN